MGHSKAVWYMWGGASVGRPYVRSDANTMAYEKELCFLLPLDKASVKEFLGEFSSNFPLLLKFLIVV